MTAQAFIVTGLGFGDEGKGTVTDYLCRKFQATLVIRHNGGCQAAHNVSVPDSELWERSSKGYHHTFSQFGSGTLAGARTYLSEFMVVNPLTLLNEAQALKTLNPLEKLFIHEDALVTTPFHTIANRIRERARGDGRHGSCGLGVGETVQDSLRETSGLVVRMKDLRDPSILRKKLERLQEFKRAQLKDLLRPDLDIPTDELSGLESPIFLNSRIDRFIDLAKKTSLVESSWIQAEAAKDQTLVFEGAQGILLDELYGFHPYTTWSKTSSCNARTILNRVKYSGKVTSLGLIRAFHTRHGAGPFVSETDSAQPLVEHDHNSYGEWQRDFRAGTLDLVALEYAIAVERLSGGLDGLVMTNLDRLDLISGDVPVCAAYKSKELVANRTFFYPYGIFSDVVRMRSPVSTTTARQELLGKELLKMTPEIRFMNTIRNRPGQIDFAQRIADSLQVPLMLTSHGTTYKDKTFLKG